MLVLLHLVCYNSAEKRKKKKRQLALSRLRFLQNHGPQRRQAHLVETDFSPFLTDEQLIACMNFPTGKTAIVYKMLRVGALRRSQTTRGIGTPRKRRQRRLETKTLHLGCNLSRARECQTALMTRHSTWTR